MRKLLTDLSLSLTHTQTLERKRDHEGRHRLSTTEERGKGNTNPKEQLKPESAKLEFERRAKMIQCDYSSSCALVKLRARTPGVEIIMMESN